MSASTSAPSADLRQRAWRFLQTYPGAQAAAVADALGVAHTHAEYHLHRLESAGLVRRDEVTKAYFPEQGDVVVDRRDRRLLARLRRESTLRIVLEMLEGPVRNRDLADRLGLRPSTVSYHLKGLVSMGEVERVPDGREASFTLRDSRRIRSLLISNPPMPSMAEDLISMLDAIAEA